MAQKESGNDGPSLELPSFGFGRKKKDKDPDPPAEPETTPYVDEQPEPEPEPKPEPPAPAPAPKVKTRPTPAAKPAPTPAPAPAPTPAPAPAPAPDPAVQPAEPKPEKAPKPRRDFTFPVVPALPAVLVVGALIGILAVLLTFASLKLCEAVGGTDSCGGSGLLLLVAILVLLTYLGGWLLRGLRIEDPVSTSFLAVGLLAVMAMLFFLDVIYEWWMIIVIPLVGMATYALSWWVTTRIVDTDDSVRPT